MHAKKGTPYYIAPEVLNGTYTEKCDIWSIGVMAYIMICGYPPFNAKGDKEIMSRVKRGKYDYPPEEWGNISQECKDFINRMLTLDPNKRYSAMQALKDPWLGIINE